MYCVNTQKKKMEKTERMKNGTSVLCAGIDEWEEKRRELTEKKMVDDGVGKNPQESLY